ncbi:hypothetical protein NEUTE2DRAFT_100371 [Neurospora tetrasperma FGSC 2509]|nr:hypothetical protein NEUTE2DRAFT_100371 [Neurospora tetrasperma FGSC 2509]
MKPVALVAALLSLCASLVSAGVVITPIKPEQVVPKNAGDCFFGVTTPLGCGYFDGWVPAYRRKMGCSLGADVDDNMEDVDRRQDRWMMGLVWMQS